VLEPDGDDPEPFIAPGLAPGRPAMSAAEEVPHRLVEIPQCLLLDHLAAGTKPLVLGTGNGELPALLQVPWRARAARTPPGMLFDREVPNKARVRAVVPQRCFLLIGRFQAVTGHSNTLSITSDILVEVKRRVFTAERLKLPRCNPDD
jgi:hypothetical protein